MFASLAETFYYYLMTGSAWGALDSYQVDHARYAHQKPQSASLWTPPIDEYKLITEGIDAAEGKENYSYTHSVILFSDILDNN